MRCFKSNKPNLSAQDVIENKKNRIIYKHNVERIKTKAKNFDGTISYDLTNNSIKQTGSYKKLLSLMKIIKIIIYMVYLLRKANSLLIKYLHN